MKGNALKRNRRTKRRIKAYVILLGLILCLLIGLTFWLKGSLSKSLAKASVIESNAADAPFEMTMLDVGQGLSILIKADGKYMIYDGGGRDSSSYVVSYLKQKGVKELDDLVASHYDEDHIAGLVGVLSTTKVDNIICPDYVADTKIYQSFVKKEEESGAEIIHPKAGDEFSLGNASIKVLSADNAAEFENDRSVAVRIVYGDFKVIITGDGSYDEEYKILRSKADIDSDVYIAGHHGSQHSSTTKFLKAVSPAYTMISCGAGNSYGHPTEKALKRIKACGSKLFRTDIQGEVIVYSDGEKYWFSKAPTDDWIPGEAPETIEESSQRTIMEADFHN